MSEIDERVLACDPFLATPGLGGGGSSPRERLLMGPTLDVGEAETLLPLTDMPPFPPFAAAAAAAAAAAWMSFRDAFPLFLRSRAYSHLS